MSLTASTKLRGLLEIISAANEFDNVPIRHHEDVLLRRLQDRLPVKVSSNKINSPQVKTNLLLQAHFSRFQLPPDLQSDQHLVLSRVISLLQAAVDVISSNGWLAPALAAMELAQMCVQGLWDSDSPLRQIPYFTPDLVKTCAADGVDSVFALMGLEDEDRARLLAGFDAQQVREVARFCNRYPSIDLSFEVVDSDSLVAGAPVVLKVTLERESDEDEAAAGAADVGPVIAPYFPLKKDEGWWIVAGNPETKSLLAIKRFTLQTRLNVKLEFVAPKAGKFACKLYLMSDSYLGVDQELDVDLDVAEGEESSDEEEEGEAEAGEEEDGAADEDTQMAE
ncbi:MAG: hypothetical protein BJ554DRAFT_727 [Olpidium bornovanus]|uniref:SEC63 domain-containing protein n=1 Tax=Olpidium bornovanus TaxID=278681 RepID=A0A8H7ZTM1_9FUNG|nr:MAG: hypothetical protein BJ554DRAFT_727 [Olpidium bornovanus]